MDASVGNAAHAIDGEQLSAWAVLAGGTRLRMEFVGTDGKARRIVPPFDAVASL
jgi:hypothetical protein